MLARLKSPKILYPDLVNHHARKQSASMMDTVLGLNEVHTRCARSLTLDETGKHAQLVGNQQPR